MGRGYLCKIRTTVKSLSKSSSRRIPIGAGSSSSRIAARWSTGERAREWDKNPILSSTINGDKIGILSHGTSRPGIDQLADTGDFDRDAIAGGRGEVFGR